MPIRPENKNRYPKNWKEIRQKILDRADNCCEGCGVQNYSTRTTLSPGMPRKDVKIVLTIAHLDHTPENCSDENLRAFCQRCHNRYDAGKRAEGRKIRAKASREGL